MELDKPKRIRRTKAQIELDRAKSYQTKDYQEQDTAPVVETEHPGPFIRPETNRAEEFKRVFKGEQLLNHDLYKLEPTNLVRNASYNEDAPIYENVEHSHFFHSIDSRGKPQTHCNKVGGHFHEISIDDNGKAHCGPPIREVKIKKHGRTFTKYEVMKDDIHTHKVVYRFSEKVKPITPNIEFAKVQSKILEGQVSAESASIPDLVDND